ncbi:hypothetical protein ACGFXC_34235 [Streptomyces sp. NPDC048507]|uniref:hypothetical protein n=1 Tax=Streptomyces sp. NPDC048507 TaxID=3365560 RepID=UPI0037145086
MTESVGTPGKDQIQARVQQIQEVFARRREETKDLDSGLDLEASVRRALEARALPPVAVDEAVRAELRAREVQSPDSGPEIWCELYGFLDLGYKIHLNPYAVTMVTSTASALEKVLGDAVEDFPELDAMFVPLLAAIYAEGSAIGLAAQENGSVVLIGIIPDPLPIPFPDD